MISREKPTAKNIGGSNVNNNIPRIEPGIRAKSASFILLKCNCWRYRIQFNSDKMQPNASIGAGKKFGLMMTKIGEAITANPKPDILCSAEPATTAINATINKDDSNNIRGFYRKNIFVRHDVDQKSCNKGGYQRDLLINNPILVLMIGSSQSNENILLLDKYFKLPN